MYTSEQEVAYKAIYHFQERHRKFKQSKRTKSLPPSMSDSDNGTLIKGK